MNFQDEELLRIFDRAIMPDSLHGQTLPVPEQATGNDFQNIALTELQTYCDGLEQKSTLSSTPSHRKNRPQTDRRTNASRFAAKWNTTGSICSRF